MSNAQKVSEWVLVPAEPTQLMLRAGMDDLGWWVEPCEARLESGVPVEQDMSVDEAARINALQIETVASLYVAMLRAAPTPDAHSEVGEEHYRAAARKGESRRMKQIASERAAHSEVGVKDLEWEAVTDQIPKHAYASYTGFGRWLIVCEFLSMNHMVYRFNGTDYATLDEAKAAAQSDFAQRVQSGLTAGVVKAEPVVITDEMSRLAMVELSHHWDRCTQPTMQIARLTLTAALASKPEGER